MVFFDKVAITVFVIKYNELKNTDYRFKAKLSKDCNT